MNEDFIDTLAEYVLDTMDQKTMEQYVYDMLVENYTLMTQSDLVEYVDNLYGPEWFDENGVERPEVG